MGRPRVGETVPNSRGWLHIIQFLGEHQHKIVGETVPNSRGWLPSSIFLLVVHVLLVGETVPNSRGWLPETAWSDTIRHTGRRDSPEQ